MLNNRQANRRRGRGNRPQNNGGGNGNRVDSRARGNAPQLLEKYKNMARDAQMAGDRVMTEYYLQFADHYFRVVAENRSRFEDNRPRREDWQGDDEDQGDRQDSAADMGRESGYEGDQGTEEDVNAQAFGQQGRQRRDRQPRDARPRDGNRRPARRDMDGEGETAAVSADAPATIDAAVLPPSFASPSAEPVGDVDAPAPRVRARRPRKTAAEGVEAAE